MNANPHRILIFEDGNLVRSRMNRHLAKEGYAVQTTVNAKDVLLAVRDGLADLILLDLYAFGEDGLNLIKDIRERSNVPIMTATTHSTENDCLKALRVGADDYQTKPFATKEIILRIRNIFHRISRNQAVAAHQHQEPNH